MPVSIPSVESIKLIFIRAFEKAHPHIEKARENVLKKRNWIDDRSDDFKESDKYQEWEDYLDESEDFLRAVLDFNEEPHMQDGYPIPNSGTNQSCESGAET